MGYIEKTLLENEEVVFRGKLHWSRWIIPVVASIILAVPSLGVSFLLLFPPWFAQHETEIAVTGKRVILKKGWISRKTFEMNLSKVETVTVEQGVLDRIFGSGTLIVIGSGGSSEPFKNVDEPLEFRKAVFAGS